MPESTQATDTDVSSVVLIEFAPDRADILPIRIVAGPFGIAIYPEQYGDFGSAAGRGSPALFELAQGKLRLVVWADINQEDPTHVIDLSGAMEDRRRITGN